MKNLCDFSKLEASLARCVANIREEAWFGSRRRPASFAVVYEVVLYEPQNDWFDNHREQRIAPSVFRSILRSEADAALIEARECIAAAVEIQRMKAGHD